MHILDISISSFRGFRESGKIAIDEHCTVVVGRNSTGKTAFLEALTLQPESSPHRSLVTRPVVGDHRFLPTHIVSTVKIDREEMQQFLASIPGDTIWFPDANNVPTNQSIQRFNAALASGNPVFVDWSGPPSGSQRPVAWLRDYGAMPPVGRFAGVQLRADGTLFTHQGAGQTTSAQPEQRLDLALGSWIANRIYLFAAIRPIVSSAPTGTNAVLARDGSNLAEVLGVLQSNANRFSRFNAAVRTVLPEINGVSVGPTSRVTATGPGGAPQAHSEVLISLIDPARERPDLAMRLNECGTGVAQVLAILYVAINSDHSRTILIDEPQSFLHPGAARTLVEWLRAEASQHQYVIATNSPAIVTAATPNCVLRARLVNSETIIAGWQLDTMDALTELLGDVGVRMSDVFGADRILWVEGRTEEECYPIIVHHFGQSRMTGTVILGLQNTGDLEGPDAELAIRVYERLSTGSALLPPAVGFLLDRELRTETKIIDLERRLQGKVLFLDRRMFENYLIDPMALLAVVGRDDGFPAAASGDSINKWLEGHRWDRVYFEPIPEPTDRSADWWKIHVNGARLLNDLFRALSGERVRYDKIRHGVALTRWLIEHNAEVLRPVATLLERALSQGAVQRM